MTLNSTIVMDGLTKKIISLPFYGAPVFPNTQFVVSGWGETMKFNETNEVLRSVTLNSVSRRECMQLYANEQDVKLTMRMICAFAIAKDSCTGDST